MDCDIDFLTGGADLDQSSTDIQSFATNEAGLTEVRHLLICQDRDPVRPLALHFALRDSRNCIVCEFDLRVSYCLLGGDESRAEFSRELITFEPREVPFASIGDSWWNQAMY